MTEGNRVGAQPTQGGPLSRKKFLAGSAAALAGGALMALPKAAQAHRTPEPPTDIDMLNYALTLEHLEAVFYVRGLAKFDNNDFTRFFKENRPYRRQGIEELEGEEVRLDIALIREHEVTHVKTLQEVIRSLGGKPVPQARYNFGKTAFTSIGKFISVARLLENTGVKAYDGAIAHIEAAKLLTAGATIATVEARHAAYLNLINGLQPFPSAFDEPVAPRAICEKVQGFIVSAPRPYGPYKSLDALCARLPNTVTPS
ncbi:MAG: ferritin-like domain-containing protein [Actinomycetota bacterium]|nr:ferritin-like domain-containing protein [Actinomycetota bacterium]